MVIQLAVTLDLSPWTDQRYRGHRIWNSTLRKRKSKNLLWGFYQTHKRVYIMRERERERCSLLRLKTKDRQYNTLLSITQLHRYVFPARLPRPSYWVLMAHCSSSLVQYGWKSQKYSLSRLWYCLFTQVSLSRGLQHFSRPRTTILHILYRILLHI